MSDKLKVGFIGLGLMGLPMARNLQKAGFLTAVYNRTLAKAQEFQKSGISLYPTPKQLAENVDVVISCVTGPKDVRQIMLGKSGVAMGANSGLIVIDMSTIGQKAAMEIGSDLKQMDITFLDAPVTGGTSGAEAGTLSIFVGGDQKIFEKVKPILESMGKNIHYMGQFGMGQATKLVNNLIVGETTVALAEGFLLGEQLGLTRQQLKAALENVFAISPSMRAKMPSIVNNKFPVTFSVANLQKDLKLAKDESTTPLPQLSKAELLYKKGMAEGLSGEDVAAVIKVLEKS